MAIKLVSLIFSRNIFLRDAKIYPTGCYYTTTNNAKSIKKLKIIITACYFCPKKNLVLYSKSPYYAWL
jgi:hypothetical protein